MGINFSFNTVPRQQVKVVYSNLFAFAGHLYGDRSWVVCDAHLYVTVIK